MHNLTSYLEAVGMSVHMVVVAVVVVVVVVVVVELKRDILKKGTGT